jgi:cell shape-determining protein MreD
MNFKKLSISRFIYISLLFLVLSAIQTSALSKNGIFGITPDIILPTVIAIGYFEGPFSGGAAGLYAGILIEAAGGSGLCIYPMLYMLFGYIFGALFISSLRRNMLTQSVSVIIAMVVRSSILIYKAASGTANFMLWHYLLCTYLPEIIISTVISLLIFPTVALLHKLTNLSEK